MLAGLFSELSLLLVFSLYVVWGDQWNTINHTRPLSAYFLCWLLPRTINWQRIALIQDHILERAFGLHSTQSNHRMCWVKISNYFSSHLSPKGSWQYLCSTKKEMQYIQNTHRCRCQEVKLLLFFPYLKCISERGFLHLAFRGYLTSVGLILKSATHSDVFRHLKLKHCTHLHTLYLTVMDRVTFILNMWALRVHRGNTW